jgi:hypothetical protein
VYNDNTDFYSKLDLRKQIYLESKAMAKYAMAKGKSVPVSVITSIETFENQSFASNEKNHLPQHMDIIGLVDAHQALARIIDPASPQTILLLDQEQKSGSIFKSLGPVSLVRELMLAAIISIFIFVALISSPLIDSDKMAEDVLKANGMEQLARLLFYIGAAGLGASFAALYKANSYITNGTFDPNYHSSYWIRFSLGIIAGLLLAVLISENSIETEGILSRGVIRPLLAILGGFSADLLYAFLIRIVDTFKSLFESSTKNILDAKAIEAKAKLAGLEAERRIKLSQSLIQMQQQIGQETNPEQIKQQLNNILENLIKA